ncbi:MAG TPA: hypothetical protein ENI88_14635 [Desulfobulbus sp.]|nr:hypothetical protein [Desulfobulbus sp.]
MMEKMMGQDGPMGDMMKNMQSMGPKDKMSMMTQMMPKCMSMMFGMLDPADRKALAGKMLNQMQEELKKQADAPEGTAGDDKQQGCG